MRKLFVVDLLCLMILFFVVPYAFAAPKTIKWKYSSYVPKTAIVGANADWILSEIEKRSEGKIKFERFWSAALGKPAEYAKMLKANVVQMALLGTGYTPDIFKLSRAYDLHMLSEDAEAFAASALPLYESFEPFREEWTKNGMMLYSTNVGARFTITSKIPLYKWEDLKGAKVRAYGPQGILWKKWGANAINIPFSDAYQALERGTIDVMTGVFFAAQAGMKFHEVVPYVIDVGEGAIGLFPEAISLKAWSELPEEVKAIFMEVQKEALNERWTKIQPRIEKLNIEAFKKANTRLIVWSNREKKRGYEQGMPDIHKGWIDEMKKNGLPGEKFLSLIKKSIKEYRSVHPNWLWKPPTWSLCSEQEGGIWQNGVCSPLPE